MSDLISLCYNALIGVRKILESKYGCNPDNMMGKCIEGSDTLEGILKAKKINAKAYQVWALYEYFESCSDYCYEEHWIVVVETGSGRLYLDPTFNQFQWAMHSHILPKVYIGRTLPNWLLPKKPGRTTLNRCGWNDFYNGYRYINDFDYWGYLDNPQNKALMKKISTIEEIKKGTD